MSRPRTDAGARVSLCIPTWQGEGFLDATLEQARGQTHTNLDLLVSIDRGTDRTAEIAARHAAEDPRVRVFEHTERQGWARNVNASLDRVETDLYAIYFHDDRIEPEWVERLLAVLVDHPQAGSAYCAVTEDRWINRGQSHEGTAFERMVTRLVSPTKGSPLRALHRRSRLGAELRLLEGSFLSFNVQHAYLLELMAAAPSLYLPDVLYHRWHQRAGGLTDQWKSISVDDLLGDLRLTTARMLETIDARIADPDERRLLQHCAALALEQVLRSTEVHQRFARATPMEEISPRFAAPRADVDLERIPERWRGDVEALRGAIARAESEWQTLKDAGDLP